MRLPVLLLSLAVLAALFAESDRTTANIDPEAIDRTCKPCDDFAQFTMGAWLGKNPIPPAQNRWGKIAKGAENTQIAMRGIAESLTVKQEATNEEKNLARFYAACMDLATIDAAGINPIESGLKRIRALATHGDIVKEVIRQASEGNNIPFSLSSSPSSDDPNKIIAAISPAATGLPERDYYFRQDEKSKETRVKYAGYMRKLFVLAGRPEAEAASLARRVLEIETSFAEPQMTRVEYRDPQKTKTKVSPVQLREMVKSFDWPAYFKALNVPFVEPIGVIDPKFMAGAERQLAELPVEDWKTLIESDVLRGKARSLSAPFRAAAFEFQDAYLGGRKEEEERWKTCVRLADSSLGDNMGKAYTDKLFPPAAKAKMDELVKNLLAALDENIGELDWMTPETKARAKEKLATFVPKIGYPSRWRFYAGSPMETKAHAQNLTSAAAWRKQDQLAQIGKPTDRGRWLMTAPTLNAYYNPLQNEIVFPAGILIPPMFDLTSDDAVNYGAIGSVIGHEISHGFDDSGSQFDAQGKLKNWWSDADRTRFTEKAECVVDQFNGYFIDETTHHNGKLVLGESIGDLAGMRIAYSAYRRSLRGKPTPADRDGFTHEQRFFVGMAQAWGSAVRIETQRLMVNSDPHPVPKFRVNGPLANMPEFHQAFGCKRGDKMVRERQCKVW